MNKRRERKELIFHRNQTKGVKEERETKRKTGIIDLVSYDLNQHVFIFIFGRVKTSLIVPMTIS